MRKIWYLLFLLPISLLLNGCSDSENKQEDNVSGTEDILNVYTTVYPLQFFTEEIGGNFVQVETIYPPGADEHTFEPSQKDMMNLADSDLFFYVGFGLEGFVNKAKESLKNEHVTMVAAGESTSLEVGEQDEEHAGANEEEHEEEEHVEANEEEDDHAHSDIDPHLWLDPLYAKEMANAIKEELVKKLPEQQDELESNFQALSKKLDQLDSQFQELIASSDNKQIIVSHAAYGYWESRYGIEQISISGLSSTSEPSQRELEKIIKEAQKLDTKYIFFEQNVKSTLTEIVQQEIGAEPLILHNLSVRTDDDLKQNRDYFSIMEDNIEALHKAIQ